MRIIKMILLSISLLLLISCSHKNNTVEKNTIDAPLQGYSYDESDKRYINSETGIWYIRENNLNIIPKEEYIQEGLLTNSEDFTIENRNNDVWKLSELQEVTVEVRDGFYSLSDLGYNKHYRMDKYWYYEQVKALNELEDINVIEWHGIFKIPIYNDSGE